MNPRADPARPSPEGIADAFRLEGQVHALSPVVGAWSNRLFQFRVGLDTFAVKEMRNPWGDEHWLACLTAAWDFEQRALAAGVDAPEPIPNPDDGHCLAWVAGEDGGGPAPVRLHRWVDGRPADPGPVDPRVARWAGQLLATLHDLKVRVKNRDLFPRPNTDTADSCAELVNAARLAGASWAEALAELASDVKVIARLATAAGHRPHEEVMTHGDIDQKNIVLSRAGPVLCDWDVVLPLVPRRELADVALSLAAWKRIDIAREVVRAYERARGVDVSIEASDLGQTLTGSLDWVAFNVERAIGLRQASPAEISLAMQLVPALLSELPRQVEVAERAGDVLNG